MFGMRLPGKYNKINTALYKTYRLKPLEILLTIEYDHPLLTELREKKHEEHLKDEKFRLTTNYLEQLSADSKNDQPMFSSKLILEIDKLGAFGERMKLWRKKEKLTQKELASQMDISTSTYGRIERGLAWPNLVDLCKMFKAFWPKVGMNVHEFIKEANYYRL